MKELFFEEMGPSFMYCHLSCFSDGLVDLCLYLGLSPWEVAIQNRVIGIKNYMAIFKWEKVIGM